MKPRLHARRTLASVGLAAIVAMASPLAAQDGPLFGGTFVAAISGEPGGLNPVLFQGAEPQISTAPMFDPLVHLDMDGEPRGVLAESWTWSDDRMVLTFTLREGVLWHDGEPLTSEDVLWTFKGTRDGTMAHPRYRATLDGLVESYEAPDPQTFRITLRQPYAPFLRVFSAANFAMPIMPKHVYDGTDIANNPANWAPIGSGPFRFRDWVRGSHIELERNPDYFIPDQPRVDSVFIRVMPDETARLLALRQGEIDYIYYYAVAYSAIPALEADPGITVTADGAGLQGLVQMLALNLNRPPFDDLRARQALAHLIDRDQINQLVYFGLARPTYSNIGITTPFWTEDVQERYDLGSPEANLAEAERLLDEAGITRDSAGNRFTVSLQYMTGRPYAGRIAEILDESLRPAGIRMTATPLDRPAFIEQTHGTWNFDVAEQQFSSGAHPFVGIPRYLLSDQHISGAYPSNSMGYANPDIDALFAASVMAESDEEEAEIWAQVQQILAEDLPIIPIVEMPYTNVHRSEWRDVFSSIDGVFDVTRTVWSVDGRPER